MDKRLHWWRFINSFRQRHSIKETIQLLFSLDIQNGLTERLRRETFDPQNNGLKHQLFELIFDSLTSLRCAKSSTDRRVLVRCHWGENPKSLEEQQKQYEQVDGRVRKAIFVFFFFSLGIFEISLDPVALKK
jgi:hypothetical protein